jgi:RloB-like protein
VYVVCGGKRTEPDYLSALGRSRHNPAVAVTLAGKGWAPEKLVNHAMSRMDDFDQVWCVLDVDEFDLVTAVREASKGKVRLVVSNPCFELWLLLHHENCGASLTASDVNRRLRRHVPRYDKRKLVFAHFAAGVDDAVERGRRLDAGTAVGPNPSSGVWLLVDTIMKEATV